MSDMATIVTPTVQVDGGPPMTCRIHEWTDGGLKDWRIEVDAPLAVGERVGVLADTPLGRRFGEALITACSSTADGTVTSTMQGHGPLYGPIPRRTT